MRNIPTKTAEKSEASLNKWLSASRKIVNSSFNNRIQEVLEAVERNSPLSIFYQGGSDNGRLRKFTPATVFRTDDSTHTYVAGYCHLRNSQRVLRIDKMSLA